MTNPPKPVAPPYAPELLDDMFLRDDPEMHRRQLAFGVGGLELALGWSAHQLVGAIRASPVARSTARPAAATEPQPRR